MGFWFSEKRRERCFNLGSTFIGKLCRQFMVSWRARNLVDDGFRHIELKPHYTVPGEDVIFLRQFTKGKRLVLNSSIGPSFDYKYTCNNSWHLNISVSYG